MIPDDHDLFRDDLADRRRERDRQREPSTFRRPVTQLRLASALDLATAAVALDCPACGGPVFAPGDSGGERVDCFHCEARLLTRRAIDGSVSVVESGGAR